jgi:hypothetical protein
MFFCTGRAAFAVLYVVCAAARAKIIENKQLDVWGRSVVLKAVR